jgi:hypothetical protein
MKKGALCVAGVVSFHRWTSLTKSVFLVCLSQLAHDAVFPLVCHFPAAVVFSSLELSRIRAANIPVSVTINSSSALGYWGYF